MLRKDDGFGNLHEMDVIGAVPASRSNVVSLLHVGDVCPFNFFESVSVLTEAIMYRA